MRFQVLEMVDTRLTMKWFWTRCRAVYRMYPPRSSVNAVRLQFTGGALFAV